MQKYIIAYLAWLLGVLCMAGAALAWYRHVEQIGLRELAARMAATDAPEATDTE